VSDDVRRELVASKASRWSRCGSQSSSPSRPNRYDHSGAVSLRLPSRVC
jgi:hypothetical protein